MDPGPIVVPPGEGHVLGNVEFLARTVDTPRFNFSIIEIVAGRVLESHVHEEEDDAFYILEGELVFAFAGREVRAGPAPSSSSLPASSTNSETRATARSG
jgi:mannose-6-phosphate isomerase-like protein (cupin superfamily)